MRAFLYCHDVRRSIVENATLLFTTKQHFIFCKKHFVVASAQTFVVKEERTSGNNNNDVAAEKLSILLSTNIFKQTEK